MSFIFCKLQKPEKTFLYFSNLKFFQILFFRFGKWYHGQILSIVDGAEGMCRSDEAAFQHEIWDDVKIDEKYFYVTWIGFTKTWNEWMSSERVYKDNDLLTIAQGIKTR